MAVVPFFVPRAPAPRSFLGLLQAFCLCFDPAEPAKLVAGMTIRRRGGQRCKPKFKAALSLSGLGITVVGASKRDCDPTGLAVPYYPVVDSHHRHHNLAR